MNRRLAWLPIPRPDLPVDAFEGYEAFHDGPHPAALHVFRTGHAWRWGVSGAGGSAEGSAPSFDAARTWAQRTARAWTETAEDLVPVPHARPRLRVVPDQRQLFLV